MNTKQKLFGAARYVCLLSVVMVGLVSIIGTGSSGGGGVSHDDEELTTYYRDGDGDGYGDPESSMERYSQPQGYVTDNTDCDDAETAVSPGVSEVCADGVDNDCDGITDEGCVVCTDADGDGYYVQNHCGTALDCDDASTAVNPGAEEICDEVDNNCDGQVDEGCSSGTTSNIPDTGQTACYDAAGAVVSPCPSAGENNYGQDATYTISPPDYTKLDAGGSDLPASATQWSMVRDNVTGLIWEVKTDQDDIADYADSHDADNMYTWYDDNPATNGGNAGTLGAGTDTQDFVDDLNTSSFGGYSDWRLPTIAELDYLADLGVSSPAIDTAYFPSTVSSSYWSSDTQANASGGAWRVVFDNGFVTFTAKSNAWYVRAVRGGQTTPAFTDNGDGTISDQTSGLMWVQDTADVNDDGVIDADDEITWQNALAWCENLSLAGYNDWRLPTEKELISIIDYSTYTPAIDTVYFSDTESSNYWSSTTFASGTSYGWSVHFNRGYDVYDGKSMTYYVRAVRGGQ